MGWPTCLGSPSASSASFKPCLQGSLILLLVCSIFCSYRSWCSISYMTSISCALAALPATWRPLVADWLGEIDHASGDSCVGSPCPHSSSPHRPGWSVCLSAPPRDHCGLANLVPYMSIVVGLVPTLVLFLLSDAPSMRHPGYYPAVYWRAITRRGVFESTHHGRETGLHPVVVMVAILVGGTLFGCWASSWRFPSRLFCKSSCVVGTRRGGPPGHPPLPLPTPLPPGEVRVRAGRGAVTLTGMRQDAADQAA